MVSARAREPLRDSNSIPMPFLFLLMFWLAVVFASFGLFAPLNGTAIAALLLCSMAVSGGIVMILELDSPFSSLLQISPEPMEGADPDRALTAARRTLPASESPRTASDQRPGMGRIGFISSRRGPERAREFIGRFSASRGTLMAAGRAPASLCPLLSSDAVGRERADAASHAAGSWQAGGHFGRERLGRRATVHPDRRHHAKALEGAFNSCAPRLPAPGGEPPLTAGSRRSQSAHSRHPHGPPQPRASAALDRRAPQKPSLAFAEIHPGCPRRSSPLRRRSAAALGASSPCFIATPS